MSENPTKHTKVLIIGSGPAGYTAAVYAARAMLNPILVHGIQPGGQLTTTTDVENYPGFSDVIQGPWLMDQMRDQAKAVGTELIEDHISSVNLKSTPFEAVGDSGQKFTADSIIISKFFSNLFLKTKLCVGVIFGGINFQKLLSSIFSCIKSKSKALASPST